MSADLNAIADLLTALSKEEAGQLATMAAEKWGVDLTATVTVAPPPAVVVAEKTEFTVTLTAFGASKIEVIKTVRGITLLGLKEAKDLVEALPKVIKSDVDKAEATRVQGLLVAAGATVVIS